MITAKNMASVRVLFCTLIAFMMLLNMSSCLSDDELVCHESILALHIKAINASGVNITSTGATGDVRLFIFDNNQKYMNEVLIPVDKVKKDTTVNISIENSNDNLWLIAWGNLTDDQNVTPLSKGMSLQEATVKLKKNAEGYAINPDDLFLGVKNMALKSTSVVSDTSFVDLVMTRKTALVNIIAKGLDPKLNDYYFIISGSKEDAFTFDGKLTNDPIEYKQAAQFDYSNELLISSAPFRMFPLSDRNYNTISIYQGSNLIVSAHIDDNTGQNIVPIVGVTNNIFINITEGIASINVNLKITDWNILHNWVEW